MSKELIFTLYEGHYHQGVAALLNSVLLSGFAGEIIVGYKGKLPDWTEHLNKKVKDKYELGPYVTLEFIKISTEFHFGYYKPFFLKQLLENNPNKENFYYFDPDIIVNCNWTFFTKWISHGVALCLDNCFPFISSKHPWRNDWLQLDGANTSTSINFYVNSGFIGINRNHSILIDKWIELTEKYRLIGGDISQFEKEGTRSFKGDQDLLNASISVIKNLNYSIIGQEAMGFTEPAYIMYHCANSIKPWKRNFTFDAITKGIRPSNAEKKFFTLTKYPIKIYKAQIYLFKKIDILFATIISRVIAR